MSNSISCKVRMAATLFLNLVFAPPSPKWSSVIRKLWRSLLGISGYSTKGETFSLRAGGGAGSSSFLAGVSSCPGAVKSMTTERSLTGSSCFGGSCSASSRRTVSMSSIRLMGKPTLSSKVKSCKLALSSLTLSTTKRRSSIEISFPRISSFSLSGETVICCS